MKSTTLLFSLDLVNKVIEPQIYLRFFAFFILLYSASDKLFFWPILLLCFLSILLGITFFETKYYITRIQIKNNLIVFDFQKWNTKQMIDIPLEDLTFKIRNSTYFTISSDRLILYNKNNLLFRQFLLRRKWSIHEINKLAEDLKSLGIKKPFGENL